MVLVTVAEHISHVSVIRNSGLSCTNTNVAVFPKPTHGASPGVIGRRRIGRHSAHSLTVCFGAGLGNSPRGRWPLFRSCIFELFIIFFLQRRRRHLTIKMFRFQEEMCLLLWFILLDSLIHSQSWSFIIFTPTGFLPRHTSLMRWDKYEDLCFLLVPRGLLSLKSMYY